MTVAAPSHAMEVEGHPEFAEAQRIIARSGNRVGIIHRVYEAGHPCAAIDQGGVPRETIIYLTPDEQPMTALLLQNQGVEVREGWDG